MTYIFFLFQKSSTRRSDPSVVDIGIYQDIPKGPTADPSGENTVCGLSFTYIFTNRYCLGKIGHHKWLWSTYLLYYIIIWGKQSFSFTLFFFSSAASFGSTPAATPGSAIIHQTRVSIDNFVFHKVLGKGSFGKVSHYAVVTNTSHLKARSPSLQALNASLSDVPM